MKKTLNAPKHTHMSILRIAPICNGKVYVVPHQSNPMGNYFFDIPIQEEIHGNPTNSSKIVQKLKERFHLHFHTNEQPRFCIQHKMKSDTIYLYILPLRQEEDIHFSHGKFMSLKEMLENKESLSQCLQKESEFLGMAAELWQDFYEQTNNDYQQIINTSDSF